MDGYISDLNGDPDKQVFHHSCLGCYVLRESHEQGSEVCHHMHLGHCIGGQNHDEGRMNV